MINHDSKTRRINRVRAKIAVNSTIPRLSVFRSNYHIWAQIIDDKHGKTLVAFSSKNLSKIIGTKTDQAFAVGENIGKIALKKKISFIRFDRGPYKYHGRVKALAEGARKGGLKF